jgi:predicted dehydrogenase
VGEISETAARRSWPDAVAIVGGGRWARVFVDVLGSMLPLSVGLSVHSLRNADAMSGWLAAKRWRRPVSVSSRWPESYSEGIRAAIVCNAARDHEAAAEWALTAGLPVLVEKPVALTEERVNHLATLANQRGMYVAASHVFLFARYLEHFATRVGGAGLVRQVSVVWMDPSSETRHGEEKRYDAGLPVHVDWLPHVLPIIEALLPGTSLRCVDLAFRRGGAELELIVIAGDARCRIQLSRNGDARRRFVEVVTDQRTLRLDFAVEPGTIHDVSKIEGDPDWSTKPRPVAAMLEAFLRGAAGGKGAVDPRLDVQLAQRTARVIDEAGKLYESVQRSWIRERLAVGQATVDADLRYALAEILQAGGPLPASQLDEQIESVRRPGIAGTGRLSQRWMAGGET